MIKNILQEIKEEISITINKNPKRAILILIIIVNLLISNKRLAQAGYYSILNRYESLHLYG